MSDDILDGRKSSFVYAQNFWKHQSQKVSTETDDVVTNEDPEKGTKKRGVESPLRTRIVTGTASRSQSVSNKAKYLTKMSSSDSIWKQRMLDSEKKRQNLENLHETKIKELQELQNHQSQIWYLLEKQPETYGGDLLAMISEYGQNFRLLQAEVERLRERNLKTLKKYDALKTSPKLEASPWTRVKGRKRATSSKQDMPITKKEKHLDRGQSRVSWPYLPLEAETWTKDKFEDFLDGNKLGRIKKIFFPSESKNSYPPMEAQLFEKDQNRKNVLVLIRASIDQLIDLLNLSSYSPFKAFWDHNRFLYHFLIVFPTFLTPVELFQKLTDKFDRLKEKLDSSDYIVKSAILDVLRHWMKIDRGGDFKSEKILALYDQFRKKHTKDCFSNEIIQLQSNLHQFFPTTGKPPIYCELTNDPVNVMDIDTAELARQMTLIEAKLFHKIRRDEFLRGNWTKTDKEKLAPNLLAIINHGNRITTWITTELLRYPSAKCRVETLTRFINLLQHLEQIKNFNALIQVLSSLHSSTISKLKKTWELVSKRDKDIFDRITVLMSNSQHYKAYHEVLHQIPDDTPCIPLISVICSDLFCVEDTMKDRHSSGSINWAKMDVVAARIWEAKRFEHVTFNFTTVTSVQNFITKSERWEDDDICYEIATLRDLEENTEKHGVVTTTTPPVGGPPPPLPTIQHLKYTFTTDLWKQARLSERDWKILMTGAQLATFQAGDVVLSADMPNEDLWRIKSGKVKMMRRIAGVSTCVATITSGHIFGATSMCLRFTKGRTGITYEVAEASTQIYHLNPNSLYRHTANSRTLTAVNLTLAKHLAKLLQQVHDSEFKEDSDDADPTGEGTDLSSDPDPDQTSEQDGTEPLSEQVSEQETAESDENEEKTTKNLRIMRRKFRMSTPVAPFLISTLPTDVDESLPVSLERLQPSLTALTPLNTQLTPPMVRKERSRSVISSEDPRSRNKVPGISGDLRLSRHNVKTSSGGSVDDYSKTYRAGNKSVSMESSGPGTQDLEITESSGDYSDTDEKFNKLFGLKGEIVVNEMNCTWSRTGKRNCSGTLYLSQNYLCFASTTFGFRTKELIAFEKIRDINLRIGKKKEKICINCTDVRTYHFGSFQAQSLPSPPYQYIKELWQTRMNSRDTLQSSDGKGGLVLVPLFVNTSTPPTMSPSSNLSTSDPPTENIPKRKLSVNEQEQDTPKTVTYHPSPFTPSTTPRASLKRNISKGKDTFNTVAMTARSVIGSPTITTSNTESNKDQITPQSTVMIGLPPSITKRTGFQMTPPKIKKTIPEEQLKPSDEEWQLILKGAKLHKYKKGEYIIREGQLNKRLYQVDRGECSIIKNKLPLVGSLGHDDGPFGEISFIMGGLATADVLATQDSAVHVMEAYWLNILFQHKPYLASRFYYYLATVIAKRVSTRLMELEEAIPSSLHVPFPSTHPNSTQDTTSRPVVNRSYSDLFLNPRAPSTHDRSHAHRLTESLGIVFPEGQTLPPSLTGGGTTQQGNLGKQKMKLSLEVMENNNSRKNFSETRKARHSSRNRANRSVTENGCTTRSNVPLEDSWTEAPSPLPSPVVSPIGSTIGSPLASPHQNQNPNPSSGRASKTQRTGRLSIRTSERSSPRKSENQVGRSIEKKDPQTKNKTRSQSPKKNTKTPRTSRNSTIKRPTPKSQEKPQKIGHDSVEKRGSKKNLCTNESKMEDT